MKKNLCVKLVIYKDGVQNLIEKPEGKRTLRNPRHKWKDNNKTDLRKTGRETVKLINLV
jgi:hypothetical protein